MDYDWMRERLSEFRAACEAYNDSISGYTGDSRLRDVMYRLEPTAKRVLRALDPALADFQCEVMGGPSDGARNAVRGLGMIEDAAEIETRLRPVAPALPADELHPWAWDAARTFWEAGTLAVAVEQAAKSITAHTQQKLDSHALADDDLMAQAWSDDEPRPDRPRLRMPGDRDSATWKSRQRGARALAQGCYGGIRNVAAHEQSEWPQQIALEYLATLSVLARWIDEAVVEQAA